MSRNTSRRQPRMVGWGQFWPARRRKAGHALRARLEGLEDRTLMTVALLKDINRADLSPAEITTAGGSAYFVTPDLSPNGGADLWATDGTIAGTALVKAYPAAFFFGSAPDSGILGVRDLTNVNGTLYFVGPSATQFGGEDLDKVDPATKAVSTVVTLGGLGIGRNPTDLLAVGDTLYLATQGVSESYLLKTDGTSGGTTPVMTFPSASGGGSIAPSSLVALGGKIFFSADDATAGQEVWVSDGTPGGTQVFTDLNPGPTGSNPASLTVAGGKLFFYATVNNVSSLYASDGTPGGTKAVASPGGIASPLTAFGTKVFFAAQAGSFPFRAASLWSSDGTVAGTAEVEPLTNVADITAAGTKLFLTADDGAGGRELLAGDGTAAGTIVAGTVMVPESTATYSYSSLGGIYGYSTFGGSNSDGATPTPVLTAVGSAVDFAGFDATRGLELWHSDGTTPGTATVADLNPGTAGSDPTNLAALGAKVIFAAHDAVAGNELWVSDNTAGGTKALRAFAPAATAGSIGVNGVGVDRGTTILFGGSLYFAADDGEHGPELWKTDGTAAGTTLVKDIHAGPSGSSPSNFTIAGTTLFFTADDGIHGRELWKSDGTPTSTTLVTDLDPGPASGATSDRTHNLTTIIDLVALGSSVYFLGTDGTAGHAGLWRSDGTPGGTTLAAASQASFNAVDNLTVVGSTIDYTDRVGGIATQLFKYDPATGAATQLTALAPAAGQPQLANLAAAGGKAFFTASDGAGGLALFSSDGTPAGGVLVKDLANSSSAIVWSEVTAGSTLFFSLSTSLGYELWASDGTAAGTVVVAGDTGQAANPSSLTALNGSVFFLADGSTTDLYRTDGTVAGTTLVGAANNARGLVALGGSLYYTSYDGTIPGYTLTRSDGTAAGTGAFTFLSTTLTSITTLPLMTLAGGHLLALGDDGLHGAELLDLGVSPINHAPTIAAVPSQTVAPGQTLSVNIAAADPDAGEVLSYSLDSGAPTGAAIDPSTGKLTFVAPSSPVPVAYAITVRVTDNGFPALLATTSVPVLVEAAATDAATLLKDVNTFPQTAPGDLIAVGSGAFFTVIDPAGVTTLWHTDGSIPGTLTVRTFPPNFGPQDLISGGGGALFFAADNPNSSTTLWKSDGSVAGTVAVRTFPSRLGHALSSLTALGSILFFAVNDSSGPSPSLWKSDGTAAGTGLAQDFTSGAGGNNPEGLTAVGSTLFFITSGGALANGLGVWSIGQTGAASQITTIAALAEQFSSLGDGFAVGSRWVFSINHGIAGGSATDLYASDGTLGGTIVIKAGLTPDGNFATLGGTLIFGATETSGAGEELWATDGTPGGTALLKDINFGPNGSSPADFATSSGKVFFTAVDNAGTRSVYTTDGTPGGTKVVAPILALSLGADLAAVGGGVVFSSYDAAHGRELWSSDGTAASTSLLKDLNPGPVGSAPDGFTAFPGGVLFTTTGAAGQPQLFVTDGTSGGTKALASFPSTSNDGSVLAYAIGQAGTAAVLNNVLYYAATDGDHGTELYRSDATAAGTSLVTDLVPGPAGSNPSHLLAANGAVYFVTTPDFANSGDVKVHRTDGTAGGTVALLDLGPNGTASPDFVAIGSNLYFLASTDGLTSSLYRTDGSVVGTGAIAPLTIFSTELVTANGKLFFANSDAAHGSELWTSDGTPGGTALLADLNTGSGGSNPANFTAAGARVFFSANDGKTGAQLWTSDGTPGGTARVTSLGTPAVNQGPTQIASFGTLVAFTTSDGGTSEALYVSDGTPANTKPLTDSLGNPLSGASDLKVAGGRLYFTLAAGASAGLWSSDGTAASTLRVITVAPTNTYVVGAFLDFTLGDSGGSLYQTNGTLAGTVHLLAGPNSVAPLMALPGGALLVAADDGTHGGELAIAAVPGSVNHAPTLDNIPAQIGTQGNLLTFQAVGHDQDAGQTLIYSLDAGAPPGAAIVAETGVFSFTPTTADAAGDDFVTVRATDNGATPLSASQQVKITVNASNHKPILGAIGDQTIDEGSTLTLDLKPFSSDPDAGQALTYSLDSAAPSGLAINASTGILTYSPASGPSLATVTVHVTDNGSPPLSSDPRTFHFTVNDIAPLVALPAAGSAATGVAIAAGGSFTDPGHETWTATVNYGDGSGNQPLSVNQAAKTFALSHVYASPGTYSAQVTVNDGVGKTGTATEIVTVSTPFVPHPGSLGLSAATAQVSERGNAIQFPVTRTNGSDGTVTVNYATADGSAAAGSAYVATSGTLTFAPGETSKTITVPIRDEGLFSGDKVFGLTLSTPGGGATLAATNSTLATIHDDDPAPPLVTVLPVGSVTSSKKLGITGFVISVSGKLDAASAQNLGNYQLFQIVKKGKKTSHKNIPLKLSTYNDAAGTITLAPLQKKLALKGSAVLQITGDGIRDLLGRAVDANHDGQPGGTGTATVTSKTVSVASIVAGVHAKAVDQVLGTWRSRPKG